LWTSWAIEARQLRVEGDVGVSMWSRASYVSRRFESAHCSAVAPLILGIV
jgi:hypothetical protein